MLIVFWQYVLCITYLSVFEISYNSQLHLGNVAKISITNVANICWNFAHKKSCILFKHHIQTRVSQICLFLLEIKNKSYFPFFKFFRSHNFHLGSTVITDLNFFLKMINLNYVKYVYLIIMRLASNKFRRLWTKETFDFFKELSVLLT